jgi:hypothetical protein
MTIRLGNEVRLGANHVAECGQRLYQDRDRVCLGVRFDGLENVTDESVVGCLINGGRPVEGIRRALEWD